MIFKMTPGALAQQRQTIRLCSRANEFYSGKRSNAQTSRFWSELNGKV